MTRVGRAWAIAGLALAGCRGPEQQAEVKAAQPQPKNVEAPESLAPTELALIMGHIRLRVGDTPEDAERAFPTPAGATSVKELPQAFNGLYRAAGYENAAGGFGGIYHDNRLAAGVWKLENITYGEVRDILQKHTSAFGEPTNALPGPGISYWFWVRQDQRLMICAAPDREQIQRFDVTIGMGHQKPLDALRMNYQLAREDQSIAEKRRSQNPPGSSL